jgi:hypothetical protein
MTVPHTLRTILLRIPGLERFYGRFIFPARDAMRLRRRGEFIGHSHLLRERDAAVARAEGLQTERDQAIRRAAIVEMERDEAVAGAGILQKDRDATAAEAERLARALEVERQQLADELRHARAERDVVLQEMERWRGEIGALRRARIDAEVALGAAESDEAGSDLPRGHRAVTGPRN